MLLCLRQNFFTHTELTFKTLFKFSAPKSTGPSKCHANFELDFSFLELFLAFKFFSWLFSHFKFFSGLFPTFSRFFSGLSSRLFCRLFLGLIFSTFFTADHIRQRPGLILGFVTMLFIAENVIPWSLTSTFLSYNKAMLSQEILFGNEFQRDLAACRVSPLFLHKVCGIWRAFLIFVVLVGEETIVTPRGCCRCIGIALRGCGSQGLCTLWGCGQGGL